jgi:transketolase
MLDGPRLAPREFAHRIRRLVIECSYTARVGHIGSALSVVDVLAALYGGVLRLDVANWESRDRFVMSKGHAALALYAALALRGLIEPQALDTYCADGTLLGVHPDHRLHGVEFSTGSLGQGLSFAAGMALAARIKESPEQSIVLMSDAELNEGAVWESMMFAAHHRLGGLVAVVDANGQQALGLTRDVLDLSDLARRWRDFAWDVVDMDGHDVQGLIDVLRAFRTQPERPHVLIARTVFGRGVSFMERQLKWHYSPMSDEEYRAALREVEQLG